jgi:hypothetical protein
MQPLPGSDPRVQWKSYVDGILGILQAFATGCSGKGQTYNSDYFVKKVNPE